MTAAERFIGTRPISGVAPIDIGALERYLSRELPGFEGPLQVEQFNGGQSNPTYKLTTPTKAYVLRTKPGPASKLLPSAHAIEREFQVMSALLGTSVPVPRMERLCLDESVVGRAFYLMEYVAGRIFWDPALPGLGPLERSAIYDEMNRVLAALHRLDPSALGLQDFGRPGNYFERQIARWSRQYLASVTGPNPAMDRLIEWLPSHVPESARDDTGACVVHGDYRLDNLIFDRHSPRVLAVLDWELSTIGHPLADFSYHCMAWHIPPGVFRGLGGLDLQALGLPAESDYIRRYGERTARTDPARLTADWNFYLAYNLFRIAAILQGIAKRVEEGTASSAEARATGAAAPTLATLAWRFAERS